MADASATAAGGICRDVSSTADRHRGRSAHLHRSRGLEFALEPSTGAYWAYWAYWARTVLEEDHGVGERMP